MTRTTRISSPGQLLVEGNDQRNFFEALCAHLGIRDAQVRNFGGVDELGGFLQAFVRMPGFEEVSGVGVVRDAETSAHAAFQSARSALERAGLIPPASAGQWFGDGDPKTGVLALPDGRNPGMLETLLCRTLEGLEVARCIDSFFDCVKALPGTAIDRPDKARAFAYLTTRRNPHHSVGVAARRGAWDLDHPVLEDARAFLTALFRGGR